jgi:hypothetical protein
MSTRAPLGTNVDDDEDHDEDKSTAAKVKSQVRGN